MRHLRDFSCRFRVSDDVLEYALYEGSGFFAVGDIVKLDFTRESTYANVPAIVVKVNEPKDLWGGNSLYRVCLNNGVEVNVSTVYVHRLLTLSYLCDDDRKQELKQRLNVRSYHRQTKAATTRVEAVCLRGDAMRRWLDISTVEGNLCGGDAVIEQPERYDCLWLVRHACGVAQLYSPAFVHRYQAFREGADA